jgi:hypothetical protein
MITRKLSQQIREQNWFGAFIDMMVVVVGIFVGLQATDWNQNRLESKEADFHLNFLHEELLEAARVATDEIEKNRNHLQDSFEAMMLFNLEAWEIADRERFDKTKSALFHFWGPRYRPVSLRRMIDDGKLDLIESKELQKAILQFDSAYMEAMEQTKTSSSYSLLVTPKITTSMKFKGPEVVSTSDELLSNQTLRSAVRDKAILLRIQLNVLIELQSARAKLIEILDANLIK